jgi:S1-C subfamily serine protease
MQILEELSQALASAVAAAGPSVARVQAGCRRAGSGIVYRDDGLILTASHVLRDEDEATVGLDSGIELAAQVVGRDPGTDLALLRTDAKGLTPLRFVEPDGLAVGHFALALGRPGRSVRASLRIIGVLGPEVRTPGGGRLERYVETDRALPHGFAGGPLVDASGAGIGLDTDGLVARADLAVPSPTLRRVVDELLTHGRVRRGYLGVAVQRVVLPSELRESVGRRSGALVLAVEKDGPAKEAGVMMGDVIVAVDGAPIEGARDLADALRDKIGVAVTVKLVRAGELRDVAVKTRERG